MVGLTVYVLIIVWAVLASSGKSKFKLNVLTRMLTNHVQLMLITVSFKLDYPSMIDSMMSSTSPVADLPSQLISFDCFIDQRNADGTGENTIPLLFSKLIITVMLPLVLMGVSFVFWYSRYRWNIRHLRQNDTEDEYERRECASERNSRILTTNLVVLFIIHPSLVKVMFDMFN